jgi:hypothetical protein
MRHTDRGMQLSINPGPRSQGGSPGGGLIVRLEHIPSHGIRGQAVDGGSFPGDGMWACAQDSSGLFLVLVLNLASACGTAPDRAARPGTSCPAVTSRKGAGGTV